MTAPHRLIDKQKSQSGFTLLEVLIALVILSVGLLGLAKMQLNSIKFTNSALLRSQAVFLAYDIFERMRANRTMAVNGAYNTAFDTVVSSPPDCVSSTCSTAQMVTFDLAQWKSDLAALLPSGGGEITPIVAGGMEKLFTISIRWDDERKNTVTAYKTFSLRSEI
ncbi:MAG: type IV pilus modification protein PilV [Magnetococcales bacterium]|nr:type IV pilus modification protein PilV [Magnetococcales bacterium]